ncbi:MAG: hypothetical protein ACN6OK_01750 [Alcaligenes faecalis]
MTTYLDLFTAYGTMAAATGTFIAAIASAYAAHSSGKASQIAAAALEIEKINDLEEAALEMASQCMTHMFESLKPVDETGIPNSSRYAWLTAARQIIEFEKIKRTIKSTAKIQKIELMEDYWRSKMVNLLEPIREDNQYFQDPKNASTGHIPQSVLVVVNFASWREGRKDPLDSVGLDLNSAFKHYPNFHLLRSAKTYLLQCQMQQERS